MDHVSKARALLGVPWVHQGRDPKTGIDCIGLGLLAFEVTSRADYGRHPHNGMLRSHLIEHFGEPVEDAPRVGDVLELAGSARSRVGRHVAIVGDYRYGGLSLIHTDNQVGCVTEHELDDHWMRRITGVFRK